MRVERPWSGEPTGIEGATRTASRPSGRDGSQPPKGRRGAWWSRVNPTAVIVVGLVCATAVVLVLALKGAPAVERVMIQTPAVEKGANPEREPERREPAPPFTARQLSDLTTRRVTTMFEVAQAKRSVAEIIATLSTDGHRFPDNSVIQYHDGMKAPARVTYEVWWGAKQPATVDYSRAPAKYHGTELGRGRDGWNQYDFDLIERHARHLWDPEKHADLKVAFWPGARFEDFHFKPDTYEQQLIEAHHAVWRAARELVKIEAALDRLGG